MGELWDFLTTSSSWGGRSGITHWVWAHGVISLIALAAAAVLAIPLAALLGRRGRARALSAALASAARSLPTLAVLGLAVSAAGIGTKPTLIAMMVLATPPIFASTYTAFDEVDSGVRGVARALGMTTWQSLRQVELPLAVPLMLTGIRIAAVQVIATATLGALVGFSGLGSFIEEGRLAPDTGKLLGGSFLVIVMALGVDAVLGVLVKRARAQASGARPGRLRKSATSAP